MESPTLSAGGVRGEMRADAQQLSTSAANRVHSELDARKGAVAEQARSVSSAIDRAAGELGDGVPQWLKSAFQQGAEQIHRLADSLEQENSRELVKNVQTMARNNPGTFLLGCATLGFAAARIFKAGASESSPGQSRPAQFPPVPVDEPTFSSSSADPAPSASPRREFV